MISDSFCYPPVKRTIFASAILLPMEFKCTSANTDNERNGNICEVGHLEVTLSVGVTLRDL